MIAERRDDRGMSIEVGLQLVEKRIDGRLMSDAFSDSSRAENAVRSAMETVLRVDLLQRALGLVVEALDLAAEPLRRIEGVSVAMEEGDSSESEGVFEECSSE